SGKELIMGEPDASSFPSGGLRATFEARGYTAWDPSSYAFIKEHTLCIPTACCSYSGEVLDKKTPLLRSMEAVSAQAVRILHLFGKNDVNRVVATVGPEQEYFLVDKKVYLKRQDLINTGRTLLGARPPKGQEMDDHYFGNLKSRVALFMEELDRELWKLGILAKTEHNEVAPAQHELAIIYGSCNVATDHNQLTMEMMKKIADKHEMVCLLHEKPFAGINGSGKHNNWSLSTNTGLNLLEPGESPKDNEQFLLFLVAIIAAVDDYQDLLRISVASAGNDHRLGANEAPPAIVSIYLGDELTSILEVLANGGVSVNKVRESMLLGVPLIPPFPKDSTDRNRTSPFAFTGNKFEFRMLGSSFSVSGPNIVLNTIVADKLCDIADILEKAPDFSLAFAALVKDTYQKHRKIVFNGNNYSPEWLVEATKRGLLNLPSAYESLPLFVAEKNIAVFKKFGVFSPAEMASRCEIMMESYVKTIHIEALTLTDMILRQILPSLSGFTSSLACSATQKLGAVPSLANRYETELVTRLGVLSDTIFAEVESLKTLTLKAQMINEVKTSARFYGEQILPVMASIRYLCDESELLVDATCWPMPTYEQLLFSV
ncbi:MAG: glutamine synthetase III, partial [Sphaerochaeta sp.]